MKTVTVGIDARLYGTGHAGIGRYIANLIHALINADKLYRYKIFLPSQVIPLMDFPDNVELVPADISHYSVAEQIYFLELLKKHELDLMHFPHFNVPIFYNKPFVVTIHDILWHQVRGTGVTTLSAPVYYAKYLAYLMVVKRAVYKSQKIIVPSKFVREQILKQFSKIDSQKVEIIYEGVDHVENMKNNGELGISERKIPNSYYLYTGSCYPHKNVATLIRSIKVLKDRSVKCNLLIVSSRSIFHDPLIKLVAELGIEDRVDFLGYVKDSDLEILYKNAIALIHPSLSEGFGLTGLEAMNFGCPVIASDKGSLPEVYGDAALFVEEVENEFELAEAMSRMLEDKAFKRQLISRGDSQVKKYSWKITAKKTLEIFKSIVEA